MIFELSPWVFGLILFLSASLIGVWPIRKLIQMREANHELKRDSAGFLRTIGGWSFVAFWVMAVWFCSTIIGDWAYNGDLDAAYQRSLNRLELLLRLAQMLAESD